MSLAPSPTRSRWRPRAFHLSFAVRHRYIFKLMEYVMGGQTSLPVLKSLTARIEKMMAERQTPAGRTGKPAPGPSYGSEAALLAVRAVG
jgi:hypothetical protein